MTRHGTPPRTLLWLLLGVNVLLAGAIFLEFRNPDLFVRRVAAPAGAIQPADSGATPATTRLAPVVTGEAAFAAIAARPLFSPTRRPPEGSADGPTGPVSSDLSGYAVTGIVTSADGGVAILEKTGVAAGQEPGLILSPGDTIEGWTVDAIREDRVVVLKDGERQELILRKDDDRPRLQRPRAATPAPAPRRLLPRAPELQQQRPQQPQQPQQNRTN